MTIARSGNFEYVRNQFQGSSGALFLRVLYRPVEKRANPENIKSSSRKKNGELRTR
jgi:hypothetical protein